MQVSLGRSVYLAILTPQQFLGSQSFHHLSLARVRKPCDASQPSARQRICNPPTVPLSHQQCACNICSELSHEAMSVHDGRCVPSLVIYSNVQQKYSRVQHSTARTHRFDVWCMQYSKYSRYSRYSNTALYSKLDVPPELMVLS